MRKLVLLFAAGLLFALPSVVSADVITIQAPKTAPNQGNGGANQFNLDHHEAYTWRIAGLDLTGRSIASATLTFHNISNCAFGFDPDCHFWNDGITFSFTTCPTPTPEPATLALLGTGLAGLYYGRKRKRQKAHLVN